MYITQSIANRIKLSLKEQNKNMKSMLVDLDLGINTISEFAKGRQMSCISLARIADYLDCSVDYLLGRTDNLQLTMHDINCESEAKLLQGFRELSEADQNELLEIMQLKIRNKKKTDSKSSGLTSSMISDSAG